MVFFAGRLHGKKDSEQVRVDATDVSQRETESQDGEQAAVSKSFGGSVEQQKHREGNGLPETLLRKHGEHGAHVFLRATGRGR